MTPDYPLPAFLASSGAAQALEELEASVAVIDPGGRILWVNPAWDRRGREWGLTPDYIEQHTYFDGMTPDVRGFYQKAFATALETSTVFDQIYDCSTPERRHIFHGRALPIDGKGLIVEHSLVLDATPEALEAIVLPRYVHADDLLLQCSHCRRIRGPTPNVWDWMSAWAVEAPLRTSHVICPLCAYFYWERRLSKRAPNRGTTP